MTPDQRQALENFSSFLKPAFGDTPRILYAPGSSAALAEENQPPIWLKAHGYPVEELDSSKDLRLMSLKKESYDGIWCGSALLGFSIEDAQRIVASFFMALAPRSGILFLIHGYPEAAMASMMRQNGYQTLLQGHQDVDKKRIALISRRI